MKKVLIFFILTFIIFGVFYFVYKNEAIAPVVVPVQENVKPTADAVETYLKENIVKLSPIEAVLGGTWYVVSSTVNLENNSGTVVYEDGHIQETRNFTYTIDEKGNITSLIIK
jgi:hypothetical protein